MKSVENRLHEVRRYSGVRPKMCRIGEMLSSVFYGEARIETKELGKEGGWELA